jgi:4-hydroxy-4-methyl-2-oxoglutarate aldolase
MPHKIVRNITRADPAVIETLGDLGVATVHEAQHRTEQRHVGLMWSYMRPVYPSARVAGSAITVSCPPRDNLMIHAALEVCRPGDVLVVAMMEDIQETRGMFGDLLATSCRAHGIAGLVIDSGVRDTADLTAMQFPVWSKTIFVEGTLKATAGSVNVPIICAGAEVAPGDVIVGDADGVVVVKRHSAGEVAQAGLDRRANEARTRARLKAGELGLDIYGLRAKLAELGVEYEGWVEFDK